MANFYTPPYPLNKGEDFTESSPIEMGESFETDDGGMEIEIVDSEDMPDDIDSMLDSTDHSANLAEFIDSDILKKIASDICEKVEMDDSSRQEWFSMTSQMIEFLGLSPIDVSTLPYEEAAAVVHPLLMEAVVKFQAKAFVELFPSRGPIKTQTLGITTAEKQAQARRVQEYMNYQVQHEMPEYGPEMDRLLFAVGFMGNAFKKTFIDPDLGRPTSIFIKPEDLIVNYYTTSLETSERFTHQYTLSKNNLLNRQQLGFYLDEYLPDPNTPIQDEVDQEIDLIEGRGPSLNEDDQYTIYEVYVKYDLPNFELLDDEGNPSGIGLPYIIHIDKDSESILAIYRNWNEGDPNYKRRSYVTKYGMIPGLGFYDYGYIHLIGGLSATATGSLRALMDAANYSNFPAGFKLTGLRIVGDNEPLRPGEWRDVNSGMLEMSKGFMPLPFKEPSQTLMALLQFVVAAGEKFADAADGVVQDSSSYGPVGTIMALLEQSGRMFSAVHKRLHAAQGRDFKILHDLNYEWLPTVYPFEVVGGIREIKRDDFDGSIDVIPVSDPNMPSQTHRLAKANAVFSIAIQQPQIHNMPEVIRYLYEQMDLDQPDRFIATPAQATPLDPISENANSLTGKPLRVGPEQHHQAHIQAHSSFLQLPNTQSNPSAVMSLQAHIQEHMALDYWVQMQSAFNGQLPPLGTPLPPEIETQISVKAAEATSQLLNGERNRLNQQASQDPEIMLAHRGLDIEEMKVRNDHAEQVVKLMIEEQKVKITDENEMDNNMAEAALRKMEARTQLVSKVMDNQAKLRVAKTNAQSKKFQKQTSKQT